MTRRAVEEETQREREGMAINFTQAAAYSFRFPITKDFFTLQVQFAYGISQFIIRLQED